MREPTLSATVDPDVRPPIQQMDERAALATDDGQFSCRVSMSACRSPRASGEKRSVNPAFGAGLRPTPIPAGKLKIATFDLYYRASFKGYGVWILGRVRFGMSTSIMVMAVAWTSLRSPVCLGPTQLHGLRSAQAQVRFPLRARFLRFDDGGGDLVGVGLQEGPLLRTGTERAK